ncbi:MAG: sugar ABC transporter substrate-binding protein [Lapillicoccus sp.]
MELTRRQALTALLGTTAAGTLAACGGTLPPADVTKPGFGQGASGTITIWCRSETQTATKTMVDAFHKSQNRIRVVISPITGGQYVTKLATAIRGNRVPDVVDCDDINSTLFAYRDAFTDLTPLISQLDFADKLSPGHLALATRDGRHYAAPFLTDASALYCNTELFEKANVDLDATTASFDGILEAARAISKLGADTYGWTYPGNSSGALGFTVQPHIWATGTDLIKGEIGNQTGNVVGNDAVKRTLELEKQLWDEKLVPPGSYSDDASRWSADYVAGRIGMFPAGYGVVVPNADKELLAKTRVILLPGPDSGRSFFDGGDNLAIPNGSPNPSAAWEYIRFCLDLQQQAHLPDGFYAPVRSDALTPAFEKAYPLAVPPVANLSKGFAPTTLAYNLLYNQSDGPWLAMFREAVFEGKVEAAMQTAQSTYDRLLKQAQA